MEKSIIAKLDTKFKHNQNWQDMETYLLEKFKPDLLNLRFKAEERDIEISQGMEATLASWCMGGIVEIL